MAGVVQRSKVFFKVSQNNKPLGKIVFELYNDITPKTAETFRALCTGEKGIGKEGKPLHYKGTPFHRVIPNFMVQSGDITTHNGYGGESIYGRHFPDENFLVKHKVGCLSMANTGKKHTNGSQFFITTAPTPFLDSKHCVFGEVIEGFDVVKKIEATPTNPKNDSPITPIIIEDCGQL